MNKRVELDGLIITVHEMTVGEVRAWQHAVETEGEVDALSHMLMDGLRIPDLYWMSDLTADKAEQLRPSEIRRIEAAARELNPDFFTMLARIFPAAS
ncbi:hypothetical protein SFMTTN_2028 [Sulfuriferula multivorans]|uniref:Uncharacterized protein n=1 Tax=Sulfuriferula multivorans TaxID=1559896 RepID=A0A401JF08_9PROT|nr:hypothetical protein [Sulfuriferula multivorans]GBL46215.1 hypothetical protein SFMTTN_2028 [Sulfuriferula multivorans]